ncbi:hypothetical protein ACG873_06640 [Mesorhizobium sp. AaZ16]|uniref:hypothetical protein n=1 Tax=Mesorhizobium sp. AaZ16 TaxID=3402289 RepID=UPI00374F5A47
MFKKPTKATAPTLRFDLRDEDPTYATWSEKVLEFKASVSKLDQEESDLLGRLAARPKKHSDSANLAVSKLLGDEVDEADPASVGLSIRLREVQSQRRDVRAALAIAEERKAAARNAASRNICERLLPDYKVRVTALAETLISAHKANASLYELTSALDAAGVTWTGVLPPIPGRMLGATYDKSNRVGLWLKEAAGHDLIDRKIIPSELAA